MRKKLANLQRLILSDKNTRNLFFFLLLNLFFAFVELFYGLWTNSLGLLSDSFHMLFDCSALLLGLAASIIAKWRPNEKFTYGFGRAETLAGLANGLFLLFIAMFIMKEAIERTFEPPEVHHERLFVISVLGFLVNIIGIFVFQHGGQGHHHNHVFGGSCSSHSHSHDHSNGHHHNHNHHADEMHGLYSAPTISSKPSVASQSRGGAGLVALDMNGYTPGSHPVINPSSAMHADPHDHHKHHHNNNYDDSYHHVHNHHHSSPLDSAPLIHEDFSPSMPNTNRPARSKGRGQIMQSVFLHIVADTLGSVGVMISAILMNQFGWMIADPLCSLFIAILISISVYPLLRDAVYILMQRIPVELEDKLPDCMHRVRSLPGVQMVHDAHFWTLGSDTFIGSLKVDVAREADHVYIQVNTKGILSEIGVDRVNVEINIV